MTNLDPFVQALRRAIDARHFRDDMVRIKLGYDVAKAEMHRTQDIEWLLQQMESACDTAYQAGRVAERESLLAKIESMPVHCSAGFECAAIIRAANEEN